MCGTGVARVYVSEGACFELTILDMLDALEAEIAALRAQQGRPAAEVHATRIAAVRDALAMNGRNGEDGTQAEEPDADGPGDSLVSEAPDLHTWMRQTGLSHAEFGSIFGVHERVIEHWITGREAPPAWVPLTVRTLALLEPSERRQLLTSPDARTAQSPPRTHPFSRIEEF